MLYERLADLAVDIEEISLSRREMETSSEFTRETTVISLTGSGEVGRGEDVTYDADHHERLVADGPPIDPAGRTTIDGFSEILGSTDLFPGDAPDRSAFRNYRRWGFESAALDLALRQAKTDLATALDREYRPVRFVVSTRLGDPPSITPLETWLEYNPDLEFKLDPTSDWSSDLISRIAGTGAVRILDLKGQYEGTDIDQEPDPALYRAVLDAFPTAVIEDPTITGETRPILETAADRISWDYPISDVPSVESIPVGGDWINIKPSRFGSLQALLETIEHCRDRGISLYGGGQFELDVGREHLHAIASLFYPDAPNDVAPRAYNAPEPTAGLPTSPLTPPTSSAGLSWG